MDNYYFNGKRYDLAKVGRYKINKKLGTTEAFDQQTLTIDDIVAAIRYIVALHDGKTEIATPGQASRPRQATRSAPTTSTTSATGACARSAS